ncbi:MAG: NAD kinase [Lewinellaceae bacterium]|nr:NAD kinase [Lewinella sp.]MCB9277411.1 NAD kinase [Lewinellaceae bacterium]
MQVVVFGKEAKERDIPHIQQLFDSLHADGINTYVFADYLPQIKGKVKFSRDVGVFEGYLDFSVKKFDFVITLGGDGTILEAVTHIRNSGVPIVGINLGRLGFLSSIEKKRIPEAVSLLQRGMFNLEERQLIRVDSNLPLFGEIPFGLNDFALLKRDTSSMITIHTYINGSYLNSYWADGLIVATPTGSTGYSLSCGGPIVFPDSGNFVITPVAPHNLNVRPIVLSDDSVISFEIEGRAENFLCTLDSRFESITSAHQLAVRKNGFTVRLVQLLDVGFLETIRNKLAWGADSRNA